MCKGKDAAGFLRPFSPLVKRCWVVSLQDERRLPREELALLAARYGWTVSGEDLSVALVEAEEWANENDGLICITGSLYLVGEVMMQRNGKGGIG
jgi:folylpolyglutamate synthase/dihydropteroate synthase